MWPFLFIAAGVAAAYAFARRGGTAPSSFDPKPGEQWAMEASISPPFIGNVNIQSEINVLNAMQQIATIDGATISDDGSRMTMTITYHRDTPLVNIGSTIKMQAGNTITVLSARKLN